MNSLRATKVWLSPDLSEQEKIGAILASLDNLIILHSQKLAGLKTLKKALMQHLFPSTSEDKA
jgi:type I restriction enzyme S subunit